MEKETLEDVLIVGATIIIGKEYSKHMHHLFSEGQIITLVEGSFEYDNGLYTEDQSAPSWWDEESKDFESIYHLFGNDLEDFMDCEVIPENKYIKAIRELFEKEVETKDNAEWHPSYKDKPYYSRWFGSWIIQKKIGEPSDKIRRELRKLEKNGLVESQNYPNYIMWSLTNYQGFKPHKYKDYAERK